MPKSNIPFETLVADLQGSDWIKRCDAARLLGQSRDPRALDVLLTDLLHSDWRVRRNAAQALGALRDKRAVEPLIQLLKDRVMTVRQRAAVALGRIKDPQAIPALLDIVLDEKKDRLDYDAYQALRKFGKKASPEIAAAYTRVNDPRLLKLLVEMKYEGVLPLVLEQLKSDQLITRQMAIQEMGNLGDKRAIPYLIEQLNSQDQITPGDAARALGKLSGTEAIPVMLDLLKDDDLYGPCSVVYRAITEAFQDFSGIKTDIEKAFPVKFPMGFNIGGGSTSLPETMNLLGGEQFQMLNNMLSNVEDRMANMGSLANPAFDDAVKKAIGHATWKFGVMFADAKDAGQERVKRLIELLGAESNLTRAAAALTLPWYTDEGAVEPLKQATHDSDEIVRKAAVWALDALQTTLRHRK